VEFHVVSISSLYFLSKGLHTAHGDQTICQVVAYLGFKKTMGNFIMKPLPQKVTSLRWSFSEASSWRALTEQLFGGLDKRLLT